MSDLIEAFLIANPHMTSIRNVSSRVAANIIFVVLIAAGACLLIYMGSKIVPPARTDKVINPSMRYSPDCDYRIIDKHVFHSPTCNNPQHVTP